MKIGFIGVGVMGKSMARNLKKGGHDVEIYTRTKAKVLDLIDEGFAWHDTIASCVADKDAVISMVGYPKDVEQIYFGDSGIIANARKGACLIDMTTTSPKLSIAIYNEAKNRGLDALDAPVSGGDVGAQKGTLSIMVGGEEKVFEQYKPVFACMGTNILYEGKAGSGQHTKMANQIAIAGTISGVAEAVIYAKKMGLDVQTTLDSISAGAAGSWQMSNLGPKMMRGDFAPGFFIKHFIKDMNIALDEADTIGLPLEVLKCVRDHFQQISEEHNNDGTQAIISYYDK